MTMETLPPRAYVMSQFPEFCETFILNEIIELEKRGVPFEVFSLKRCPDPHFQPGAKEIMEEKTSYPPPIWHPTILWSHLVVMLAHPVRYFSTLLLALRSRRGSLEVLAKTLYVFGLAPWFARLAQHHNLKHVHGHWASIPSSGALFIARMAGVPFSLTGHAFDIFIDRTLLAEKLEQARYAVTCTRYNRAFLLETYPDVDPEKIHAVYHGVNLDVFDNPHDSDAEEPVILCVGRLCDTKGYPDLIDACVLLRDRGVEFKCRIVGDGYMREEVEERLRKAGLEDHVEIMGLIPRAKVVEQLERARLFVLPCVVTDRGDRDGLPNVVTEAMSMGLPVVTTNVSALPEAVIDGETGRLVPPHSPEALADAIEALWNDPETRAKFSATGRKKMQEEFGLRKNVELLTVVTKRFS